MNTFTIELRRRSSDSDSVVIASAHVGSVCVKGGRLYVATGNGYIADIAYLRGQPGSGWKLSVRGLALFNIGRPEQSTFDYWTVS